MRQIGFNNFRKFQSFPQIDSIKGAPVKAA